MNSTAGLILCRGVAVVIQGSRDTIRWSQDTPVPHVKKLSGPCDLGTPCEGFLTLCEAKFVSPLSWKMCMTDIERLKI